MVLDCRQCGRRNRVHAGDLTRTVRCGACRTALTPVAVPVEVDAAAFEEARRESDLPILVDFWAEWCGPCRIAAPHVAAVASAMAGRALVLKVDTEAHPALAAQYGVRGIPNFVVLNRGLIVRQEAGVSGADQMIHWLESAARN